MDSLRAKIILVYLALASLAVCLSVLALVELRLMTAKVQASGLVAEFFDAALELRRFEKNFFLYGQPEDLAENRRYAAQALALLQPDPGVFADLMGEPAVVTLKEQLRRYADLMAKLETHPQDEDLAGQVRALGKAIVTAGEELARRERQGLSADLAAHQRNLLISFATVIILLALAGLLLAHWVTRPLKRMEARMGALVRGRLARLDPEVRERELVSLCGAFNHVLDELERRQRTLVRSEKLASLGTLLAGVAHELNNPLSNISTTAQILTAEPDAEPEFRRELIADIDQEVQRAARIVRSLLDYTREPGAGPQPVVLAELVEETLGFLRNQRGPDIAVHLVIPPDLRLAVDRPRLQQALVNLIGNALEAMGPRGELTISAHRGLAHRPSLELGDRRGLARNASLEAGDAVAPESAARTARTGPDPGHPGPALEEGDTFAPNTPVVDILIEDTGPGIPAHLLPRIFDPFFTTKAVGQGSGLGLFIVHQIVEEHGGWIGASNRDGGGARFHLRLPDRLPSPAGDQPEVEP
ncbi:MAG TPA: ATP-binding protein [Chromatiaceae bacterium]|nr:ATP-binding protein [Chromatiaceae bacterium]